jgi:hypothetical protein
LLVIAEAKVQSMNELNRQNHLDRMNSGLLSLILAYFFPVYISGGKAAIDTAMVSVYASIYIKRNCIGALAAFTAGELLIAAGYSILGESVTGLFVVFAGLCSVCLAAMVDAYRNSR